MYAEVVVRVRVQNLKGTGERRKTPLSKGVMNHSQTAFPDRVVAISGLGRGVCIK